MDDFGIALEHFQNYTIFAAQLGTVAEWLGKALQKLLQQFESVRYLNQKPHNEAFDVFVALCLQNFIKKRGHLLKVPSPLLINVYL
jgi:hypothetical protein